MYLVLSIRFEDSNSQGEGSRTEDEDSDDEAGKLNTFLPYCLITSTNCSKKRTHWQIKTNLRMKIYK